MTVIDVPYSSGRWSKRAFDIFASSAGIIILCPVMGLVAVAIRFTSPGPVFYASRRVGLGGRPFDMMKFRTMVVGADQKGPLVTAGDDTRVTPIGRYLRRSKLDELPTLWNVLKGDMSIVGPRPENPGSAALYSEAQKSIWTIRPGITSLATLKYRNEESILAGAENVETTYFQLMQDKLSLELEYLRRKSFMLDLQIILQTLVRIVLPQ
jgi:lipopolysaccharide/colanic/teichoic acid biosynthesis glycosyltransferase